jgi:hypothetical protein
MSLRLVLTLLLLALLGGCTSTLAPTPAPTPTSEWDAPADRFLGAFSGGAELEGQIGRKFSIQLYYHPWGDGFGTIFEEAARSGRIMLATWEFRQSLSGVKDPYALKPLQSIVDGKHDRYLQDFARDAKAFGRPLFLRWGHEMNGDWYQWSGSKNNGAKLDTFGDPAKPDGPELFVAAYRHIHDVFQQEGASNVLWVWCPNVVMTGTLRAAWNDIANYYPGEKYVDWLCVDGYNWGTSQDWSSWQTFDEVFRPTYDQLHAIDPRKPIMIGETASTETGGDKAAWITDAFSRLTAAYPQIRALTWFNVNKETDWRVDSSPESLEALRAAVSGSGWANYWPDFPPVK